MSTLSPATIYALLFCLIATTVGFSTSLLPTLNYCTPVPVKENIGIEKLQIGNWVAAQQNAIVPTTVFGSNTPNYDFSLKGIPLTRDTFYWQIWVDLNGDLDFDDQGENLLKVATSRKQKAIGHLTLPAPLNGNLSVRVMLSKSKANNPCGTLAKVMDYYDFSIQEANCPKPSLDSIAIVKETFEVIKLTYTGKIHQKVIWNYPSYYQQCSLKADTTKKEISISYKNGERVSVRLKGVCASGDLSPFSDTLWFERPCVGADTSKFYFEDITDNSAVVRVRVGDSCSRGYFYYLTTDTTLHESLWTKLPDAGDGNITLKNLLPGTDYFLKISNRCYNEQASVFFSGFKPFKTLAKDQCLAPSLNSVTVVFTNLYTINLTYTGKQHHKVTWNYSANRQCDAFLDTTKRDFQISYKNGERIWVRLKGVCASGEVSPFSDTLWFERPCVGTDTSRFAIQNITDKSAWVRIKIGDWCSRGYQYYLTKDTTLHEPSWVKLRDSGDENITLQGLSPNTQYFLKISNVCYNAQNSVFYSGFKSFTTSPAITECIAIDSNEVKFRFHPDGYIWVIVSPSKISAKKQLVIEDASGYQSARTYEFYDSTTISINPDTKYLIRIKNDCGDLKSEWSQAIPYTAPKGTCQRMSGGRLRYTFKDNKYILSYTVNPELPISGPYLWRYRFTGYFNWVDTLVSDTNFIEIPSNLTDRYLSFSVIPLASLTDCTNYRWSEEYNIEVQPCSSPRDNDFGLKSISGNSATLFLYRDRVPANARLLYVKAGAYVAESIVDLTPTTTEVTLNNLEPNTEYVIRLCNNCQVGKSNYGACVSLRITTPESNFQAAPTLSLAKPSLLNGMKLVPNPSTGLFNVELPLELEGTATMFITNLNGQTIHQARLQLSSGALLPLDLSQHPQGVYLINVRIGDQLYREKLVLIK